MAKMISSSLICRWMNMKMMSGCWSGRNICSRVSLDGRDPICRQRLCHHFTLINVGGKNSLVSGNRQFCRVRRSHVSSLKVYMTQNFENKYAQYKLNGSSSAEGVRFLNTNVTVNLTQHIVQLDGKEELQDSGQDGSSVTTADHQDSDFTDLGTSIVEGNGLDVTIEANFAGNARKDLVSVSFPDNQAKEGKWWHIPDSITDVLPLPADFEERLEDKERMEAYSNEATKAARHTNYATKVIVNKIKRCPVFSDTGMWLWETEQVHKSYYDQRVPAAIKDREYQKPQASLFIDSGEVKQQYVEGLPLRTISCMTFGEAHGEVRSQLAILGDAVIGLAVSSLLVRQHSSAGTITERKCQLVSNNNLSRVWRTLLGPQEFVLSFGDSSSQPAALSRMMADSCEAYIGALYTEKGFGTAFDCVNRALFPLLVQADSVRNAVHALNVHSSSVFQVLPDYRLIGIDNPNTQHQVCRVRVYVKGYRMATGMGINQKLARIDAARKALEKWPKVFKAV